VRLPGYAPDPNAVEGAWSVMKSGLGNRPARTLDELEATIRARPPASITTARPHQRTQQPGRSNPRPAAQMSMSASTRSSVTRSHPHS